MALITEELIKAISEKIERAEKQLEMYFKEHDPEFNETLWDKIMRNE